MLEVGRVDLVRMDLVDGLHVADLDLLRRDKLRKAVLVIKKYERINK